MNVGERHGRLIALERKGSDKKGQALWRFECDCGKKPIALATLVNVGKTKSCGCLRKEVTGNKNRVHGMSGQNHFYQVWQNMLNRCRHKKNNAYKNYGGRGIRVCKRWEYFENFFYDMHTEFIEHVEKFGEKNTFIDRINNDGNYKPSNCRWVTRHKNNLNQRHFPRRMITYMGITDSIEGWAKRLGLRYGTLGSRLSRYPLSKALNPV